MDRVEHQLQQFRGAPGRGAIVKLALSTFFDEIAALKRAAAQPHGADRCTCTCTCTDLGVRVSAIELVMAGPADEPPHELVQATPEAPDQCPPLAVAPALAPVIVPILAPAVAAIATRALSSEKDPGADAEELRPGRSSVAGHYSVSTSTPNGPPVLPLHSTEEGSSEDIEAILASAESNQLDRFMSLAQAQKATSEKVRKAAAARNRRAAAKKAAIP